MAVLLSQLVDELVTQVASLPQFTDKSFSIYNIEEIGEMTLVSYPLVGVAFEGGGLVENSVSPVARNQKGAALYTATFAVILAVEYQNAQSGTDTKVTALDLMDAIKRALLGYQGVNKRPWTFNGEYPIDGGLEGVIFYGQSWQTDIPVIGDSTHP